MENEVPKPPISDSNFAAPSKPRTYSLTARMLVGIILISVVAGFGGAALGLKYLPNFISPNSYLSSGNEHVTLTEDSAIVNVVKKDSPAVVSIIISQNVSQLPGYGSDPSDNDPFFNFFFNNGQNQQQAPSSGSGSSSEQEVGAGSGFFISADGLIVTNKHVVSDPTASYTVITSDGKTYRATVQSRDPVNDLAIVKINIKNAPFLQLANSSNLQVGQTVIAIGNSLGQYQNTVTSGIISGIGRKITAGDDSDSSQEQLSNVIQTDAAINPGNSGGPLLDAEGNVVGINTAIDQEGQLVGFAIPANEIIRDIASFQKNGTITRPFLGVRYVIITSDIASQENLPVNYGALIVSGDTADQVAVVPGSPADKAGLMENDIIEQVNGTNVDENNTLSDLLDNFNPGDKVTLKVYHKGKTENLTVTLGQVPSQ